MNLPTSGQLPPVVNIGNIPFRLEGNLGAFHAELACEEIEPHLYFISIKLHSDTPATPSPFKLSWRYPNLDVQAVWHSGCNASRWLSRPWEITLQSQVTKEAPVICLYNLAGDNRLTFACSDALNHIESTASVDEATAAFSCHLHFFAHPTASLREYQATLRIDQRPCPYYKSLHDVQAWWNKQIEITPSVVPDIGRLPMYSTWYSFHQKLTDTEVEKQCRLARDFGCAAVI